MILVLSILNLIRISDFDIRICLPSMLQKHLRSFILIAVALYLTTLIVPGFLIAPGLNHILLATLVLVFLNVFIKPIIRLLLLPVNLITLGAFRWLIGVIVLYLFAWLSPNTSIVGFNLHSMPFLGVILQSLNIGRFIATVITAATLSFIQTLLFWLVK